MLAEERRKRADTSAVARIQRQHGNCSSAIPQFSTCNSVGSAPKAAIFLVFEDLQSVLLRPMGMQSWWFVLCNPASRTIAALHYFPCTTDTRGRLNQPHHSSIAGCSSTRCCTPCVRCICEAGGATSLGSMRVFDEKPG